MKKYVFVCNLNYRGDGGGGGGGVTVCVSTVNNSSSETFVITLIVSGQARVNVTKDHPLKGPLSHEKHISISFAVSKSYLSVCLFLTFGQ